MVCVCLEDVCVFCEVCVRMSLFLWPRKVEKEDSDFGTLPMLNYQTPLQKRQMSFTCEHTLIPCMEISHI